MKGAGGVKGAGGGGGGGRGRGGREENKKCYHV